MVKKTGRGDAEGLVRSEDVGKKMLLERVSGMVNETKARGWFT
jgi:hypothetical protein